MLVAARSEGFSPASRVFVNTAEKEQEEEEALTSGVHFQNKTQVTFIEPSGVIIVSFYVCSCLNIFVLKIS